MRYDISVVENAKNVSNINPETPYEKVLADCMTDYLEMRKAEEQALILRLPCKVGATVYWVSSWYCFGGKYKVTDETVESFMYEGEDIIVIMGGGKTGIFIYNVFLNKEEAEQALKRMESE